jgi:hypothetical protein
MDDVQQEKILDPVGIRTPTPRSSSPYRVAIPTTVSRLLVLGLCVFISLSLLDALQESSHFNTMKVNNFITGFSKTVSVAKLRGVG